MSKQLIIVESPAKVKTIKKFLGPQYMVQASVGHVRDLPSNTLGVDESKNFMPQYEVIENKKNIVNDLRLAASKADVVFLAPDPDREGEAIAFHVAELIKDKAKEIKRIQFNEITAKAVKEALANPRDINVHLFDAQQARRILDRLVGYKISPLLWKTVKRGISAGRVQSVALKLIVEREEERKAFKPEEYWPFKALLAADNPPVFKAELVKIDGKKANITNEKMAIDLKNLLKKHSFIVESVDEKTRERSPKPPFITSTLQQVANQQLSFPAKRTMNIAQKLYEGVELEDRGLTALITYMRTDSTRIADEALDAVRKLIEAKFGSDYLPKKAKSYKAKGGAQDAHEAIRPVNVNITPDSIKNFLPPDQYKLYNLIWTRFVASQMCDAKFHDTVVQIVCENTSWKAKGERMIFQGFLSVMPKTSDEEDRLLPILKKGEVLKVESIETEQKFTQPPARFSEASLVHELEELGIGRPSTYATIISTLQDREYVSLEDKRFVPTDLGSVVCKQLNEHFTHLMDVGFTAQMEANLDKIADGKENWVDVMRGFASDFNPTLESASKNMKSIKGGIPADINCPDCGKPLVIKFGKAGSFLACSAYPECKYTSNFTRTSDGNVTVVSKEKPEYEKVGICPECGKDLVIKSSRTGSRFIACIGYPECKYTSSFSVGVICPRCQIGKIVEKSSKRGKIFYACDTYPKCDFAMWDKPIAEACPLCGNPYLIEKKSRSGIKICCPSKGCKFVKEEADEQLQG